MTISSFILAYSAAAGTFDSAELSTPLTNLISAVESIHQIEMKSLSAENDGFNYVSIGGIFPVVFFPVSLVATMPNVLVGHRSFINPHHAIDFGAGAAAHINIYMACGQSSYLYYFEPSNGPYLGAGVTFGGGYGPKEISLFDSPTKYGLMPLINFPMTVGYQFSNKEKNKRFVQFQITPYMTGNISYGFGF